MTRLKEVMKSISVHVYRLFSDEYAVRGVTNFMNTVEDGKLIPEPLIHVKKKNKGRVIMIKIDYADFIKLNKKEDYYDVLEHHPKER